MVFIIAYKRMVSFNRKLRELPCLEFYDLQDKNKLRAF